MIDASWPDWWSDQAAESTSAIAELRYSVCRRLGLSASSFDDDAPTFIWQHQAKFKNLGNTTEREQAILSSFGVALGRMMLRATPSAASAEDVTADNLRTAVLSLGVTVNLRSLLATCWALGIPVVHSAVFPLYQKRMCAMSVQLEERYAVILGKDFTYEPQAAFVVAHELGHVFLHHAAGMAALLDAEDPLLNPVRDDEEEAADRFALELLVGSSTPEVLADRDDYNSRELANAAQTAGAEMNIDPGTLALCLGFSTRRWPQTMNALRLLRSEPRSVSAVVNGIAEGQFDWAALTHDSATYLSKVLDV